MKFTLAMLLSVVVMIWAVASHTPHGEPFDPVFFFGGLWVITAPAAIGLYWTARIVRRAWRDGTRAH